MSSKPHICHKIPLVALTLGYTISILDYAKVQVHFLKNNIGKKYALKIKHSINEINSSC